MLDKIFGNFFRIWFVSQYFGWIVAICTFAWVWSWMGGMNTENTTRTPDGGPTLHIAPFTMWRPLSECKKDAENFAGGYQIIRYPAGDHGPFKTYLATEKPIPGVDLPRMLEVYLLEFKDLQMRDCWAGHRLWRIQVGEMKDGYLVLSCDAMHPDYWKYADVSPSQLKDVVTNLNCDHDAGARAWERGDITAPRIKITAI